MGPRYAGLQGVIFFVFFFVVAFAAEAFLLMALGALFNARLLPRGLGWFMFPIAAGIAGWAFGKEIGVENLIERAQAKFFGSVSRRFRGLAAGSALWALMVCTIFLVFDPFYRYRWREDEWAQFLFVLTGPPIFGVLGIYVFGWAMKDRVAQAISSSGPTPTKYK